MNQVPKIISSLALISLTSCSLFGKTSTAPTKENPAQNQVVQTMAKEDFHATIDHSSYTLIDFHAPWCSACRQLMPDLERFSSSDEVKNNKNLKVYSFDLSQAPEIAKELGISSIPSLVLFQNGLEVERLIGYQPDKLATFVHSNVCQTQNLVGSHEDEHIEVNTAQLSEMIGYMLYQKMDSLSLDINYNQLIKGIQKGQKNGAPIISKAQFVRAFASAYEEAFEKTSLNHLHEANTFLLKNGKQSEVETIVPGKVQTRTFQTGIGRMPQIDSEIVVRCSAQFGDLAPFYETESPVSIECRTLIPGLSEALVQMKEGEIREVYIHPDFAFGIHNKSHPNSLLKCRIELISVYNDQSAPDMTHIFKAPSPHSEIDRFTSDISLFLDDK